MNRRRCGLPYNLDRCSDFRWPGTGIQVQFHPHTVRHTSIAEMLFRDPRRVAPADADFAPVFHTQMETNPLETRGTHRSQLRPPVSVACVDAEGEVCLSQSLRGDDGVLDRLKCLFPFRASSLESLSRCGVRVAPRTKRFFDPAANFVGNWRRGFCCCHKIIIDRHEYPDEEFHQSCVKSEPATENSTDHATDLVSALDLPNRKPPLLLLGCGKQQTTAVFLLKGSPVLAL